MKNVVLVFISLIVSLPAAAQITVTDDNDAYTFDLTGQTNTDTTITSNAFDTYLNQTGFTFGVIRAGLSVSEAGTLSFELIGSNTNSQFTNSFSVNGTTVAAVSGYQSFIQPDGISGQAISETLRIDQPGQIGVNAMLNDFRHNQYGWGRISTYEDNEWAVLVPAEYAYPSSVQGSSISGLSSVIFALENYTGGGSNYDDLLIRASFTADSASTPVPAPGGLGILLLGLGIIAGRQHFRLRRTVSTQ